MGYRGFRRFGASDRSTADASHPRTYLCTTVHGGAIPCNHTTLSVLSTRVSTRKSPRCPLVAPPHDVPTCSATTPRVESGPTGRGDA